MDHLAQGIEPPGRGPTTPISLAETDERPIAQRINQMLVGVPERVGNVIWKMLRFRKAFEIMEKDIHNFAEKSGVACGQIINNKIRRRAWADVRYPNSIGDRFRSLECAPGHLPQPTPDFSEFPNYRGYLGVHWQLLPRGPGGRPTQSIIARRRGKCHLRWGRATTCERRTLMTLGRFSQIVVEEQNYGFEMAAGNGFH